MQRKTLGDIVVGEHPTQHYKTVFSQKTGFFVRLEEDGYEEPFWAEDGQPVRPTDPWGSDRFSRAGLCAFCGVQRRGRVHLYRRSADRGSALPGSAA